MKKKKIIIIITIIVVIVLLGIGSVFAYKEYQTKPIVTLKENLVVSFDSEVTNLSFIEKVEKGTIETKEETVNTQVLGKREVELLLKNKYGRKTTYTFSIMVIDTEKPSIQYKKTLETTVGEKIDLLKDVKAEDNYDKELKISVEGDYDFQKVGKYTLFYVTSDSSKNETKEEFTLNVKEKKVPTNISTNPDRTFTTSKGFSGVTKNGVTYIDGILVVNKTYSLPSNYGKGLTDEVMNAFQKMKYDAAKKNLNIYISSGFRSYSQQKTLYNNYVARDGKAEADRYSARAGHSEHQSGLAFDVNTISSAFNNTKEAKWLRSNCYKYGFILRYPEGKESITGYMYESWHFRYVGEALATKLYNKGNWLTLEEYFGITSKY